MVLIKKKKRPRQEGKGGQVNVFRVEKRSEIDSKIDIASIPDDMTIEEVLVEFFNASDIEESSDGTVRFTTSL